VTIAGFLGGLVNSSVTVSELAARIGVSRSRTEISAAYQGILLATCAMLARNTVILVLLAPRVAASAGVSFVLMLVASAGWALFGRKPASLDMPEESHGSSESSLALPFSLWAALKFGFIFLVLHIAGVVTQRLLGDVGFYLVSLVGGAVSSASAVAAAASLASNGSISPGVAATGAVIASIASVAINLPFVFRAKNRRVSVGLSVTMGVIALLGLIGLPLEATVVNTLEKYFPNFELPAGRVGQ
jgi:uncharacterized membrane protein (DUF4010 family)